MITLFSITIFLSAALLFVVEPMFARWLLPLLGGAPAVWNTCMVFFQAALLAGYGYVHLLGTRVQPRRQVWVHGAVLVLALMMLPVALPAGWAPPADRNPIPWLLLVAVATVGLPFFAVSATSPLLQQWLSTTRHPAAGDPYFLYAASNLGSLVALLAYPTLIEPHLGLFRQSRWWTAGYGLLIVLLVACAVAVLRTGVTDRPPRPAAALGGSAEVSISWGRRLRWVLLALVPSSLMLSVTNYISMDIAAIPLWWVLPLAIYLGTFSLAFARRQLLSATALTRWYRLMVALGVISLAMHAGSPLWLLIPLHLAGLWAVGWMCHRELALDRPPARHLTEFYLWLSLGGVLGGSFNALLAPLVFHSVLEYPIGLLLVAFLLPRVKTAEDSPKLRRRDLLWPVVWLLGSLLLAISGNYLPLPAGMVNVPRLAIAVPAVVAYALARRPRRFALGLLASFIVAGWLEQGGGRVLRVERSFFGIHRVVADADGEYHRLLHGTTVHGAQRLDPAHRREPVAYYARTGPVGQLMAAFGPQREEVAAIGLGTGALLCYAEAGQRWTYYEIDPVVERLARDPRLFTYVSDCPAAVSVVLGDARLTLGRAPDQHYRMIILDAYNSDAIPLHLVTREALKMYLRKLRPDGVLIWHITNRHLTLEPVLAALARDAGLACRVRYERFVPPEELAATGKAPSQWAVMARDATTLSALDSDPRWQPGREQSNIGVWTDDYADLFSVLRWRQR